MPDSSFLSARFRNLPLSRHAASRALAHCIALLIPSSIAPFALANTTHYWSPPDTVSGGHWSDPANWSPATVPGAGDEIFIDGGGLGNLNQTVLYDYTGSPVTLGPVTITRNNSTFGFMTSTEVLSITANSFHAYSILVGHSTGKGFGQITQSGGTVNSDNPITLGLDANDSGTYLLSGGTLGNSFLSLSAGYLGFGNLSVSGGLANLSVLILGDQHGSSGTANLSNGTLFASFYTAIGSAGNGAFNQSGGTFDTTELVMAGTDNSAGVFNLLGGSATADTAYVGYVGAATVNQSGGTFSGSTLTIGSDTTPSAPPSAYNLAGGSLTISGTLTIAASGSLNHSAGALLLSTPLLVHGAYNLLGPVAVSLPAITVGNAGTPAAINQSAGTLTASTLTLGDAALHSAAYHLSGAGALLVAAAETIGGAGPGQFLQTGGTHRPTGSLVIGGSAAGTYQLNDGLLTVMCNELIAPGGSLATNTPSLGTFNQSGGTHTLAPTFSLVIGSGQSLATYTMTGGLLSAPNMAVGGPITFNLPHGSDQLLLSGNSTLAITNSLVVNSTGTVSLANNQPLFDIPVLSISGGAVALPGSPRALRATALAFTGGPGNWSGSLDLNTSTLVLQPAAATKSFALLSLLSQINNSPSGQTPAAGIISAAARADPAHYALGLFDNASLARTSLNGATLDNNSLLVSIAHLGDSNLSGIIDIQDQSLVTNHWQSAQSTWSSGDLNLDGFVDLQDLTLVTNNWQQSSQFSLSPPLPVSLSSPIPEPASILLLSSAAFLLYRQRRRFPRRSHRIPPTSSIR